MKVTPVFRVLGLLALGLGALCPRAEAQVFNLDASPSTSADPAFVGTAFTLYVTVTNTTIIPATGVVITNVLSPSLQIVSYSPNNGAISNGNVIVLQIGSIPSYDSRQGAITVVPTVVGAVSNVFTVADTNAFFVRPAQNFFVQVTNTTPIFADLAISLTGPAQAVITGDDMTYGITVTNLGTNDAPGVLVTNSLIGTKFLANTPGDLSRTLTASNVIYNLGTLTNGAVTNISVRVQATNSPGQLTLSASVGAPGVTDTNTANNTATNLLTVGTYLSTNLVITQVSPQSFDSLDGLMEQTITVSNAGPSSVDSTRVVASGLSYQLFNAVGTNNGNAFVVHGVSLNTNETVNLILQYFVPTHKPVPVTLQAFGIPAYNLAPPAQLGPQVGTRILQMLPAGTSFPGCAALVFDSVSNQTFTVIYSDNVAFASNVFMAQPTVKAFANQTLWVDYGPPETISYPTNTPQRFFKVFLNP